MFFELAVHSWAAFFVPFLNSLASAMPFTDCCRVDFDANDNDVHDLVWSIATRLGLDKVKVMVR